MADRQRKIKIQTGVIKRIAKEKTMYEQEAVALEKQVEEMKAQGKDEYDIRKRIEVLGESQMMGPDCEKRLKQAVEMMNNLLDNGKDLIETEEYKTAQKELQLIMEVL